MRPSSPTRLALVRLVRADSGTSPAGAQRQETVTSAEGRWRFVRVSRQEGTASLRLRPNRRMLRVDTLLSEPDSMPARDRRWRELNRSRGYGEGNMLTIPNEKELLDAGFLGPTSHAGCAPEIERTPHDSW